MEGKMFYSVQQSRRPSGGRRRTRSTGSLPWGKFSGDSSSSIGEWDISKELGMSSIQQSDSDDVSGMQGRRGLYNLQPNRLRRLFPTIESDSVNENFSPIRPTTRRKRKLKRMAVDIEMASSSSARLSHVCQTGSAFGSKKKRILRHGSNCENRMKRKFGWMRRYCSGGSGGKRKRSARSLADPPRTVLALHRLSLKDDNHCNHSSSSLSSSESDPGIYTNDEGREGDDEQSDWVWDGARAGWEEESGELHLSLAPPSLPSASRSLARYIRGGRRRLRSDKAGFTVLTSANEKLSRFLQDPDKSQLRLHPMKEQERHQLGHLAELYSLDMHLSQDSTKGLTCPVLTKTSNTVRGEPVGGIGTSIVIDNSIGTNILVDSKRRRCTPPSTDTNTQDGMACDMEPMDEEDVIVKVPPLTSTLEN